MRKICVIISMVLITSSLLAQSPEQMSYQAVIRNNINELIANSEISVQISILQGSTSGVPVYTETQNPTSNSNGLVSIEIAGIEATVVLGDFATIDWANGPCFIQTEIDPTGGTNYTITSVSQLLSVPYALHAKTAEIFTGTITELDGSVTNEIQDLQLLENILTITNNNSATSIDLGVYLDNEVLNLSSGNGISITGTFPDFIISQETNHYVGELIGIDGEDGIIFWLDHSGEHGLICSIEDINGSAEWSDASGTIVPDGATSQFNGYENTIAINSQSSASAAGLCLAYSTPNTSAGDWYLPSIDELSKIYHVKYELNKSINTETFTLGYYWSSTEQSKLYAWYYSIDIGYSNNINKDRSHYVRAIRTF